MALKATKSFMFLMKTLSHSPGFWVSLGRRRGEGGEEGDGRGLEDLGRGGAGSLEDLAEVLELPKEEREGCQVQFFTYGVSSKGIGGRERVLRSFNEHVCSALPFRPSSSSDAPPTF